MENEQKKETVKKTSTASKKTTSASSSTAKKSTNTTKKATTTTKKVATPKAEETNNAAPKTTKATTGASAKKATSTKKEAIKVEQPKTEKVEEVKTEEKKKKLPLGAKISIGIVGGLVGLIALTIGGLNALKFAIYKDYYKAEETLCKIPGLKDGFIPQDICANEATEQYLVAGYMNDNSASRIYVTNKNNESYYVSLYTKDNQEWLGHAGGICTVDGKVYIADSDNDFDKDDSKYAKVYSLDLNTILTTKNDKVTLDDGVAVNNYASSLFTDDTYIYVGEFHKEGTKYLCDHEFDTTNEGKHHAIVTQYAKDDLNTPIKIYSIRDMVQGFAILPDGRFVMSTSWGISDSHYYVYNSDACYDSGKTLDGAPVFIIDGNHKDIKGPAMAEGFDLTNGKLITTTEAASKKYIFGNFFNATNCNELDF